MCKSRLLRRVWGVFLVLFLLVPASAEVGVQTAWVSCYPGITTDPDGGYDDDPFAVAVDRRGNVYVTGRSATVPSWMGGFSQYLTIAYDASGNELWLRRLDGSEPSSNVAWDIEAGSRGGVYVAGRIAEVGQGFDYATVKYDSLGNQLWIRKYNGPGNDADHQRGMVLDQYDNIYVTGTSYGIGTRQDYATIKYSSDGTEEWIVRLDHEGRYDQVRDIAIDDNGNIYITGHSWDNYDAEVLTVKYNSNGDTVWTSLYQDFRPIAIAVDYESSVYVAGYVITDTLGYDFITMKYDSLGQECWVRQYNGLEEEPGNDVTRDIAIDGSGNVYVTGIVDLGVLLSAEYATLKYSSSGELLWVRHYGTDDIFHDEPFAMAVDQYGDVFVTGSSGTVAYDSLGNELWVGRDGCGLVPWYEIWCHDIALDHRGGIYVTGRVDIDWIIIDKDYGTVRYLQYVRGDASGDYRIDVGDVVYLVNFLFKQGAAPNTVQAGDANCDQIIDLGDVVFLINYLYKGGTAPDC